MPDIKYAQTEAVDKGSLKVEVLANRTRRPIEGAKITISYSGKPDSTVEEVSADDSGMSEKLTLDAPPLEYSMEPSENQPFAQYTVKVTAPGYRPVSISGVQVFSEQLALQQVRMAEENEEAGRLPENAERYWSMLEDKSVHNIGRLRIKRYLSLLANKKLRQKYLEF